MSTGPPFPLPAIGLSLGPLGVKRTTATAIAAVAASIREFGFRQPLVIDENNVIIVGHTRYKAAQQLGLATVPVHVAIGLTPAQRKGYRIADNKTAEIADWEFDKLVQELTDLQQMDFDLDQLGFSAEELHDLFHPGLQSGQTDPDSVPEPPDEPTTRPGDLWLLGQNRLLCGDSSKPEDVDRLLDGAPIHLVNTDPPYNVKVEPRSNNAIAAGLSSFPQHAGLDTGRDLCRHPEKATTTKKLDRFGVRAAFTSYIGNGGAVNLRPGATIGFQGVFADSPNLKQFTDGTSQTIMVGERPPPDSLQAGWWYPRWWFLGEGNRGPNNAIFFGATSVGMDDNCAGKRTFGPGRTDNPCDRHHLWSLHPGGANFLFVDGSTRFLSYSAEPLVIPLATRNGGEVVNLP